IEMESKPFISYNEMMKFIVENIFKEDVRFVEVLCNKIEMISRLKMQSTSKLKRCLFSIDKAFKRRDTPISENKNKTSKPKISLEPSIRSNAPRNVKFTEIFKKKSIVSLHEQISDYGDGDSKIRAEERRIETSKDEGIINALLFKSVKMGKANTAKKERNIRAIAFRSKSTEGKIMLNFIEMKALRRYEKKERDSLFHIFSNCAVFVLYENNTTYGYGFAWE
ncbi:hypothetical protein ENBRE01_3216, partial [Enteropsectra breve]